jgi:hypothetical protein
LILYYYKDIGPGNNPNAGRRDGTFSYEQFTECSIEELKDLAGRGGGSKSPGFWRDRDGKMRDRDGNLV